MARKKPFTERSDVLLCQSNLFKILGLLFCVRLSDVSDTMTRILHYNLVGFTVAHKHSLIQYLVKTLADPGSPS